MTELTEPMTEVWVLDHGQFRVKTIWLAKYACLNLARKYTKHQRNENRRQSLRCARCGLWSIIASKVFNGAAARVHCCGAVTINNFGPWAVIYTRIFGAVLLGTAATLARIA